MTTHNHHSYIGQPQTTHYSFYDYTANEWVVTTTSRFQTLPKLNTVSLNTVSLNSFNHTPIAPLSLKDIQSLKPLNLSTISLQTLQPNKNYSNSQPREELNLEPYYKTLSRDCYSDSDTNLKKKLKRLVAALEEIL